MEIQATAKSLSKLRLRESCVRIRTETAFPTNIREPPDDQPWPCSSEADRISKSAIPQQEQA